MGPVTRFALVGILPSRPFQGIKWAKSFVVTRHTKNIRRTQRYCWMQLRLTSSKIPWSGSTGSRHFSCTFGLFLDVMAYKLKYVCREEDESDDAPHDNFFDNCVAMALLAGDSCAIDTVQARSFFVNFVYGNDNAEAEIQGLHWYSRGGWGSQEFIFCRGKAPPLCGEQSLGRDSLRRLMHTWSMRVA